MTFIYLRIIIFNDIESFILSVFFSIQLFVVLVLKLFHSAPRPAWIHPEIEPSTCYGEFGNPSGHTVTAAHFTMYLYFVYVLKTYDISGIVRQKVKSIVSINTPEAVEESNP